MGLSRAGVRPHKMNIISSEKFLIRVRIIWIEFIFTKEVADFGSF